MTKADIYAVSAFIAGVALCNLAYVAFFYFKGLI